MQVEESTIHKSICRICMQGNERLHPIFDNLQLGDSSSKTIADIITECTKYPVVYDDKLPTNICSSCMESARNAHLFKRQTEDAYCRLKALYDIAWVPKEEVSFTHSSTSASLIDKYTQTEKTSVFQCESCPQKFFAENELRQHRSTSHIQDGKVCRVFGEKFNHLGQLKVHLSSEHPNEGIRCDFKCEICLRDFTRKDHLKRHLHKVHKILDDKLNVSKVSLEEPEIHIEDSANASTSLNNYSSHWHDYLEEERESSEHNKCKKKENIKATNPFSSDDDDEMDHHGLDEMDEDDVKQFVETLTHPVISIKVEHNDAIDSNTPEKKPSLHEIILQETNLNKIIAKEECSERENCEETEIEPDNNNGNFQDPTCDEGHQTDVHSTENETEENTDIEGEEQHKAVKSSQDVLAEKCIQKQNKKQNTKSKTARRRHGSIKSEDNICKECNRSFSRYNHLLRHMLTHSDEKPHICSFCSKGFSRSDHLQKHIQSIHCEKNYKCDQCDSAYGRKDHLLRHIETRHNKNPSVQKPQFECDMCEKKFTTKTYLARHKLLHTDRLYACKHCPETFQEKEQMKEHQKKEHSQPRNFLCSICGDSFQRNEYLKIHMRRHTGEKPYKCRFCEKGFPRSTDLKMHERYHIGLKPNLCNLCGKGFHRPYNLTIHMRTHTGEKPYKCNQCPQAFAQSNDLKAHIRRHTGERFRCDMCSAPFLQRYGLNAHLRTVHGIIVTSFTGRLRKTDQPADGSEIHQDTTTAAVELPSDPSLMLEHQQGAASLDPTHTILPPQHPPP